MISATIVIPFHNEKKNLEILSNELINALENKPKDIEVSVIFVNDNSNDGGNIYISKFINELENFRIINLEKLTQYSVRFSVNSFLLYIEQRKIDLQAIFESQGWKWDLKEVYNRYKTKKWKHTVYLNNGVNPLED